MEQNDLLNLNTEKERLPNSTTSLVLGIVSLVFACVYGFGIIFAIIGFVLANKDRALYAVNPGAYTKDSLSNTNAGRTCSIISIVLSLVFWIFIIAMIALLGLNTDIFKAFKH